MNPPGKELLIVFVKNLIEGKVKTRLAKSIGDKQALDIYKYLLAHTLEQSKNLSMDKVVYYSEFIDYEDDWGGCGFIQKVQVGKDLGEQMQNAFIEAFAEGYSRVILIGSDSLDVTKEIISEAFSRLRNSETVIGPSEDGGYYLLGMSRLVQDVFHLKMVNTHSGLTETLQKLTDKQVEYCLLKKINDIDTIEDLKKYRIG